MDEYIVVAGQVGAFQWDLTDAELDELEELLKRKRPCGFTAVWPEEERDGAKRAGKNSAKSRRRGR